MIFKCDYMLKTQAFCAFFKRNVISLYHNNRIPIMEKDINRIKVVLAEKKRINKWLAEQLGCASTTVSKWCINDCQPTMGTFLK